MANDLILLCAINSTYQHTAFGLRYLKANLNELSSLCEIKEFTISQDPKDIAEKILLQKPKILGFGVYIWNTLEILETIKIIKKMTPDIVIILGGPEISYETENQEHYNYCDYVIQGEGDLAFYSLCKNIFDFQKPPSKVIPSSVPEISQIQLPYELYLEEDIKNRVIYVEASRGCPYKCEYCLSSLDKSVRNFNLENFLDAMGKLMEKGVREYKFVDRTFNLSPKISQSILSFFLQHIEKNLFLHFEMVPDRLPDELKELIKKFPPGSLQFEIGIQTLNEEVAKNVSRKQNKEKIIDNFKFLKEETHVHTHADLIVGLPGESLESFKIGFDQLVGFSPDEIQVGILKRLRGAPLIRHDKAFQMIYSDKAPYQILQNNKMSYFEIQNMTRFSKHWDSVANSGNWKVFLNQLIHYSEVQQESIFDIFFLFSKFLSRRHQNPFGISLIHFGESILLYMLNELNWSQEKSIEIIVMDYCFNKKRDLPPFLKSKDEWRLMSFKIIERNKPSVTSEPKSQIEIELSDKIKSLKKRQIQHL
ncbi:MAG: DUF4080 domain-containing protein [Deltaproteobacteria bacterium]|nr:DUF4080 domain-containing protein [Deltaproteobacteria bacterium]